MSIRLLERQVRLLEYLTSGDAIFGAQEDPFLDPCLEGVDRRLLRLEACFSHEKRMEKIIAALPRTFQLLGTNRDAIIREFVDAYPPANVGRLENARQFYAFLCARWAREPPEPPYLGDIAACEFACVKVRVGADAGTPPKAGDGPAGALRRCSDVVLLHCSYDIRPFFESDSGAAAPIKRDTPLAIVAAPGGGHAHVFEVASPAFALLNGLDDWTDRGSLGSWPEFEKVIHELVEHGLVEVSGRA